MSLINSLFNEQTITMYRKELTWTELGRAESTETPLEIPAIVQPYRRTQTGSQIILPEGLTADDTVVIYTTFELRSTNEYSNSQADEIEYNGLRYEIQDVSTWSGYSRRLVNQHYECLAVLTTKEG